MSGSAAATAAAGDPSSDDPRIPIWRALSDLYLDTDVSLFYSGIGAKATVYVYEGSAPLEADSERSRDEELRRACELVESQHAQASDPGMG